MPCALAAVRRRPQVRSYSSCLPSRAWRWRSRRPSSENQPSKRLAVQPLADGLVALEIRCDVALFLRRRAYQKFFLAFYGFVIGAVGERTDHGAAAALARPIDEAAQLLLARLQFLPPRRQFVAVIEGVAARIDQERTCPVVHAAAAECDGGTEGSRHAQK